MRELTSYRRTWRGKLVRKNPTSDIEWIIHRPPCQHEERAMHEASRGDIVDPEWSSYDHYA